MNVPIKISLLFYHDIAPELYRLYIRRLMRYNLKGSLLSSTDSLEIFLMIHLHKKKKNCMNYSNV